MPKLQNEVTFANKNLPGEAKSQKPIISMIKLRTINHGIIVSTQFRKFVSTTLKEDKVQTVKLLYRKSNYNF